MFIFDKLERWRPRTNPARSRLAAESAAAGLAVFALYGATLERGVSLPDSAVIMEAMQGPAVSAFACNHTLNNLIGWCVCRLLPFGDLAWRCNAVSAGYGAGVVGLFYALIRRLGGSRVLSGLCAASLAVAHGLWWHSTVVENYALSALLFLVLAHLLVSVPENENAVRRRLFALFFVAGLAVLNHLQNGLLGLGCAAALLGRCGRPLRPARWWLWAGAGGILGLAPYLAVAVWEVGTGRTGADPISWLLGGGGFESRMFCYPACGGLPVLARLLTWNFPGPFLAAIAAGAVWSFSRGADPCRRVLRLIWTVALGDAVFFLGYETWDRFSFFLVPFVGLAVVAAAWLAALESRGWGGGRRRALAVRAVLAAGVAVAPLFYGWQHRLVREGKGDWQDRKLFAAVADDYAGRYDLAGMLHDPVAKDDGSIERFVRRALASLPAGAVWVDDGSTVHQAEWLQRREGLRTDVRVELLANPVMRDYGTDAYALAMRCQWRGAGSRWFAVTDRGPAAKMIEALHPFGWRAVPFRVGEGLWLFELIRPK